jgi:hypothetical protein
VLRRAWEGLGWLKGLRGLRGAVDDLELRGLCILEWCLGAFVALKG